MPQTTRQITYPDSAGHTRLWEHLQTLAETTDLAISNALPRFAVFRSTATPVLSTGTNTTVKGWTIESGASPFSGMTDGVGTIAEAGAYIVVTGVHFNSNATGRRVIRVMRNDAAVSLQDLASAGYASIQTVAVTTFAAGDTTRIELYHSAGGDLALRNTGGGHLWALIRL